MAKLANPVSAQDHAQGSANAPCTLVEYGDYQCPSCGQAFPIVQRVQKHFGDRLRFVFRNLPLEQHPMAVPAAEAAEFAAAHDQFWPMHDALYQHQAELGDALFTRLAKQFGLEAHALQQAVQEETFVSRIEADLQSGEQSGVRGTPTFYINGQQHQGEYDAASLIEAIEAKLSH